MMIDIGRQEACKKGKEQSIINIFKKNVFLFLLMWAANREKTTTESLKIYSLCLRLVYVLPTCIIHTVCINHWCVCFLQHLPQCCLVQDITVNKIRDQRINNMVKMCVCVRVLEQMCIRGPVCSLHVSNMLTSGGRAVDDRIKYLAYFLPSSVKYLFRPLLPFVLFCSCSLSTSFPPSPLPPPRPGKERLLSPPSLFYKVPIWITAFTEIAVVYCSFCLHSTWGSGFPLEHATTWQWWRRWTEGE